MSDFKRKVNIVESTTPPTNQYDWWYDLNNNVLKKKKGNKYEPLEGSENSNNTTTESSSKYWTLAYTTSASGIKVGDIIDTGHIAIASTLNADLLKQTTSLAILDGPSTISKASAIRFDDLTSLYLNPRIKNLKNAFVGKIDSVYFGGALDSYDEGFAQSATNKIDILDGVNTVDRMFLIVGDALVCSAAGQLYSVDDADRDIYIPNVKTLKKKSLGHAGSLVTKIIESME